MKKQLLVVLLALVLVFSLVTCIACEETPEPEQPTTYTLTYAAGGGSGTAPAAESYAEGATVTIKANPFTAPEGKEFDGWSDGTNKYQANGTLTMPAKNVVLTAQWKASEPQIEGPAITAAANISIQHEGESTTGWLVLQADGTGYVYVEDKADEENVLLYAEITYTIDSKGELKIVSASVEGAESSPIVVPTTGSIVGHTVSITIKAAAGEQAQYKFESAVYKLRVEYGFEIEEGVSVTENYVPAGMPSDLTEIEREGYILKAIKVDDVAITEQEAQNATMPAKDITISYEWEEDKLPEEIAITYTSGEGTGDNVVVNKNKGWKFNLATASEIGTAFTAPENKMLVGWKLQGDESGKVYALGEEYTAQAASTFIAQWGPAQIVAADQSYVAMLILDIGADTGVLEIYNEDDSTSKVNLTYTLTDTTLVVTINGSSYTGTLDGANINITITYQSKNYVFGTEPAPAGAPTVTFNANGGEGTAPSVTPVLNENSGMYSIALPANPYTAPAGKEFKAWEVTEDGKNNGEYKPGTYMADAGTEVVIKAIWQDVAVVTPVGAVTFVGNCTVPTKSFMGMTTGGQNYVKFVVDVDALKVTYFISTSADGVEKTAQDKSNAAHKPSTYGSDALYLELNMADNIAYYLLIKADKSVLTLCNSDDEPIDNGVFTANNGGQIDPPTPTEWTVTFDPNNGEDEIWTEKVDNNATVAKPATDPVNSSGKAFQYWRDEDTQAEYNFSAPVTKNIELTAIYAWKVTFLAGEGATGKAPDAQWVRMWGAGIVLPDGTGLSNGDKVFAGWNDGEKTYEAGERYIGTGNHTLTAVWQDAPEAGKYTLKFTVGNHGAGTPPTAIQLAEGETTTLPDGTGLYLSPDFQDEVFLGWSIKWDSEILKAGSTYVMPGNDVTLQARWGEQEEPTPSTGYTVTYKKGDHGTGADVVETLEAGEITLKGNDTFTEQGYVIIGWQLVGGTDEDSYLVQAKYNLSQNVEFVAIWTELYANYDNDYKCTIFLYPALEYGYLDIDEKIVKFLVDLDETTILIMLENEDEFTGTYDSNGLNIAITYDGTTYTFGTVTPGPNPDTGDWKKLSATDTSGDLYQLVKDETTTRLYFAEPFENGGAKFVGIEFSWHNTFGVRIRAVYESNGEEKVPSGQLGGGQNKDNEALLDYSGSSYAITLGEKNDGKFYVVSFSYKNSEADTTERVLGEKPSASDTKTLADYAGEYEGSLMLDEDGEYWYETIIVSEGKIGLVNLYGGNTEEYTMTEDASGENLVATHTLTTSSGTTTITLEFISDTQFTIHYVDTYDGVDETGTFTKKAA